MFENFDFSALDRASFKEDAVREEIIAPILRKAGYRPIGDLRVERSKPLVHPFVMIGSKRHPVNIVPDYTLFFKDKPLMVLDAKSPWEPVLRSKHVEQAYSYAIHPEVRCDHYALCNGRQFVVYHICKREPVFEIDVPDVDRRWEDLSRALDPMVLQMPDLRDFMPDYGLHAVKAGIGSHVELIFVEYYLQDIIRVRDNLYTASATHVENNTEYCVSFDFTQAIVNVLLGTLPPKVAGSIRERLSEQPFRADVDGRIVITCKGRLGDLMEGAFEEFVPVLLEEVVDVTFDPAVLPEARKSKSTGDEGSG
jgi:hypothetical protein